ncbi:hypothetical protein AMC83_CH01946 [Rhizobium phaseoli]|uniref:hypothetical protein n=1 Tax=Rhizobium phaseoli TaxID=396 RepID=UPI0007EAF881|nr:hypothetical protein [Rhizobium phaseoli]ANL71929.1 hypothetical protein AMC83_CH01946 [Rhizobium phaseoli]
MATRAGLFASNVITLFPRALSNSSESPSLLNASQYARRLVNYVPNRKKAGSGSPRFGTGKKGEAAPVALLDSFEFRRSNGVIETVHLGDDYALYRYDESSDTYTSIKSGLSDLGLLGATQFNGKLVFYNGIDANFAYDGTTCTNLGEYVEDLLATDYTWVSTSSFSLKPESSRSDYPDGRSVRVNFETTGEVVATIASSSLVADVLTVTVSGTPFPASSEAITSVEYFDEPPAFSYIHTANDILWALSGGESLPTVYRGTESMKVFYTSTANNENAWFDQGLKEGDVVGTQEVAYINLQNKAGLFDELIAIADYNNAMVFFGRRQTYVYSGYDPSTIGGFLPTKKLGIGLAHPKLLQRLPDDLMFVSPYGARTLSVQVQTDGIETRDDIGSTEDAWFGAHLPALMVDGDSYKKGRSFGYAREGYFGFKLDDEAVKVYVLNRKSKGWTEFTGYFADASSYLPLSDGRLFLTRGEQLYAYANGTDAFIGEDYSDDTNPLEVVWWMPWVSQRKRYGNRQFKLLLDETEEATFQIDRMIDYNEQNVVSLQVTASGIGAIWDESLWDSEPWGSDRSNVSVSDKFICEEAFALRVTANVTKKFSLLGIKPIGR